MQFDILLYQQQLGSIFISHLAQREPVDIEHLDQQQVMKSMSYRQMRINQIRRTLKYSLTGLSQSNSQNEDIEEGQIVQYKYNNHQKLYNNKLKQQRQNRRAKRINNSNPNIQHQSITNSTKQPILVQQTKRKRRGLFSNKIKEQIAQHQQINKHNTKFHLLSHYNPKIHQPTSFNHRFHSFPQPNIIQNLGLNRSKGQRISFLLKFIKQYGNQDMVELDQSVLAKWLMSIRDEQIDTIVSVRDWMGQIREMARLMKEFNEMEGQMMDKGVLYGRSYQIDKPYLRLTDSPNYSKIRPEIILKYSLHYHIQLYSTGKINYDNFISQIKSIRQDLTIQSIQNQFTLQVYQENCRISLKERDFITFKECLCNLWGLYEMMMEENELLRWNDDKIDMQTMCIFTSYYIMVVILDGNLLILQHLLSKLSQEILQEERVRESISLANLLWSKNYNKMARCYVRHEDEMVGMIMREYGGKLLKEGMEMMVVCLRGWCDVKEMGVMLGVSKEEVKEYLDVGESKIDEESIILSDMVKLMKRKPKKR